MFEVARGDEREIETGYGVDFLEEEEHVLKPLSSLRTSGRSPTHCAGVRDPSAVTKTA